MPPTSAPRLRAVGPHVYPLRAGSDIGGEVYERMLLERLPAHGIDLDVGVPRDHQATGLPAGVTLHVLPHRVGLHWLLAPVVLTPWVVREIRARRADLLRAHSVRHVTPTLLLARALTRARVPIAVHHHHFTPRWARLEAMILRRADAVLTVSEHSAAALRAAGISPERIHVAYDGVAGPPVTAGWPDAWPQPGLRLLHLGRLESRKRPALAIATLARLRDAGVPASLVLAGEGPEREPLRAAAQAAGLAGAVRILGRVAEADKWRLLDAAEVLLFGSTLEGFGLVVAEAQSRGVPVVSAAGAASAEALDPGRSGILAPPDPESFAAAVGELLDPDRRNAMAAAARTHAQRFDWDRCAGQVAAVYRGLLAR